MGNLLKRLIQWKLRLLASVYVWLNKIEIVAITGSAGKTTAKNTIKQIISEKIIFVPKGAYNTEYGVPLALFSEEVPENPRDLLSWGGILIRMFGKLFLKSPFQRIALEYGADKVGDISYLTSFAKPHIALVTTVLPVHLEGFGRIEEVASEKSKLISGLTADDFAILNYDDPRVKDMAGATKARIVSFGKENADITYSGLKYNETGMALDVMWKENKYQINIPVVAPQLIPSYLGAFAVGLLLGEDPKQLAKKLGHIASEKGRMNIFVGLNESIVIDDSYNSNPESAKAALGVLSKYTGHKIAILGSMNELGDFTEKAHTEVGETASKVADEVLVVGEIAGQYLYPTVLKKMNNKVVQRFDTAKEAGDYLRTRVKKGDVLLFKGSQNGVFTEEAVKCVLANMEMAEELLVRQSPMWLKKKGIL